MSEQNTDARSLAHTKWNCKYHMVFEPNTEEKYSLTRREMISGKSSEHYVNGKV